MWQDFMIYIGRGWICVFSQRDFPRLNDSSLSRLLCSRATATWSSTLVLFGTVRFTLWFTTLRERCSPCLQSSTETSPRLPSTPSMATNAFLFQNFLPAEVNMTNFHEKLHTLHLWPSLIYARNVLVEMTATDLTKAKVVMDTLITMFSQVRCTLLTSYECQSQSFI